MFRKFDSFTFFPAQAWSHTWERQHELMYRFAEIIKEDVFILPPLGLVEYNLLSKEFYSKFFNKIKKKYSNINKNKVLKNMKFINGFYIHKFDRISTSVNFNLYRNKITYSKSNFFWSTYINPTVYEFFKRSKFKIIDLAERRQANTQISAEMKDLEKRAVSEADLIVVDNIITLEDYKDLTDKIVYIPQGYDDKIIKLRQDYNANKIGYVGNFHYQIDYQYLFELIELNDNLEFLFVGGIIDKTAEKLFNYKNVKMVGEVSKDSLNDYLKDMQFGLIPYRVNELSKGIFPTKLFEYLGSGVPVISKPIPEVKQFKNDKYIFIEDSANKINYNVDLNGIEEFLKSHTWDERFKKYLKHIQEVIQ